jgi:prefoldin subunit 5
VLNSSRKENNVAELEREVERLVARHSSLVDGELAQANAANEQGRAQLLSDFSKSALDAITVTQGRVAALEGAANQLTVEIDTARGRLGVAQAEEQEAVKAARAQELESELASLRQKHDEINALTSTVIDAAARGIIEIRARYQQASVDLCHLLQVDRSYTSPFDVVLDRPISPPLDLAAQILLRELQLSQPAREGVHVGHGLPPVTARS